MNFLDAHKIVHEYDGALGKGHKNGFFATSSLPFEFDKDRIINAHKIFFAHMILYQTRTPEQFNIHMACLHNIEMFEPNEEIVKLEQLKKLADKKRFIFKNNKVEIAKKNI